MQKHIPTNLDNGHQIRHTLKIVGCEITVTSRSDFRQGLVDLYT